MDLSQTEHIYLISNRCKNRGLHIFDPLIKFFGMSSKAKLNITACNIYTMNKLCE